MAEVTIGIDIATSDVRGIAVTPDGRVVASASQPLPPPVAAGPAVEQEPGHADAAIAVLARLRSQVDLPVAGLSVTATSGSVGPCDAEGRPVGPVLTYRDTRGAGLLAAAGGRGVDPQLVAALASAPTLGRIAWLEQQRPAPRYLHVSDMVLARLAGHIVATDTSHALKTGVDPIAVRWPAALLDAVHVSPTQLPDVLPPGSLAGAVGRAAAAETGLDEGTPLVAGMTDGCTGQIAAGAVLLGDTAAVLGTTLVLKCVAATEIVAAPAIYSHRSPDGHWWSGGAGNAGGAAVRRFGDDLAELDSAARRFGPARHIRYPLSGSGERFPFAAPAATAFLLGQPVDRVDDLRGTFEGIAFTERLGVEVLTALGAAPYGEHYSVGGGTRSTTWLQIRATVLGRPITVAAQPSSAFGAAVLAAAATVHGDLGAAVAQMVTHRPAVDPLPAEAAALNDSYQRFVAEIIRRGWLSPAQLTAHAGS